ncbi:MAG: hypothetical protein CL843_08690 [Crocinitomicaceae bacterium]|nr:hypothetical protein [Crocinitomicaceae bacterium]|tara:strand:- start:3108 stop:3533 length:426 start_codon:yes stop_codon:yes gene_type:complete
MKKENLPQDESALKNVTREVCYVKNNDGKYEKGLSSGWQVKADALSEAWEEIYRKAEEAAEEVTKNTKSPIYFFMIVNLMDIPTLSGYTGFWMITIKRHFKPGVFKKLSDRKLEKYASAFKISIEELKQFNGADFNQYIKN